MLVDVKFVNGRLYKREEHAEYVLVDGQESSAERAAEALKLAYTYANLVGELAHRNNQPSADPDTREALIVKVSQARAAMEAAIIKAVKE